MSVYIKELAVVLTLSALVFWLAKPSALNFTDVRDFTRRRNIWLLLSAAAFLCPGYRMFLLIAAPILYWGGKKDSNPTAFYLLMMNVVPPVAFELPTAGIGISKLFAIDLYRLLSLCVLIPAAWRLRHSGQVRLRKGLRAIDWCLVAFGMLHVVLFIPPDIPTADTLHNSLTNELRNAFLFLMDVYLIYLVASRSCKTSRALAEAMSGLWLSSSVMACVGVFESVKHWLLYAEVQWSWNTHAQTWSYYVLRAGAVRAQATAGNPLTLGFVLVVAFGFWLYLQYREKRKSAKVIAPLLLGLGLLATYSRGPWIGAAVAYLAFTATGPKAAPRILKSLLLVVTFGVILSMTPWGQRLTAMLPFVGNKVDASTITYRERLLERSWEIVSAHPLFGDQHAYSEMQDLRQGQGIIDLVNTYAEVALNYGLVGLLLLLLTAILPVWHTYRWHKLYSSRDHEFSTLGRSIVATTLGMFAMMAGNSFSVAIPPIYFTLAGLSAAYSQIAGARDPLHTSPTRPAAAAT